MQLTGQAGLSRVLNCLLSQAHEADTPARGLRNTLSTTVIPDDRTIERKEKEEGNRGKGNAMKNVLMILVLLIAAGSVAAYPGVVSIDTATAQPGLSVTISARLTGNNIKISSMILPLRYNPAVLTLDSVTFDSTFKPDGITGYYSADIVNKTIRIVYIPVTKTPIDTITASSGVLARLHFHVAVSATSQVSKVDSINKDTLVISSDLKDTIHFATRVEFADNTGQGVYLPSFNSGGVIVMVPTGVDDPNKSVLPTNFTLEQNFPNPFNPATVIRFSLPRAADVRVDVYNVLGQVVGTPALGHYPAGTHQVSFSAEHLPSGVYFYRLTYQGGSETRKMLLLK